MSEADLNPVSVTQGDRVLTGVGADPEQLAQTMERHDDKTPIQTPDAPAQPDEKPTRGQKRFSQLTSERDKEKNRAEAAERERDELRARLARASSASVSVPERQPESVQPQREKPSETRAKPQESEIGTKYQTYPDFIEDLADWKAEQRLAALNFDAVADKRIEAANASRTQAERETQEIARGRQAYPDFDAVIRGAQHLWTNNWPDHIVQFIQNAESPEHLRYALAKDPQLAEQVRTSHPVQAGMILAKLMPAPAVVTPASTAGAGTVTPPQPYQPVGSGSKTTAPPLADLPKKGGFDFDKSGYRERRAAERGVTRRR